MRTTKTSKISHRLDHSAARVQVSTPHWPGVHWASRGYVESMLEREWGSSQPMATFSFACMAPNQEGTQNGPGTPLTPLCLLPSETSSSQRQSWAEQTREGLAQRGHQASCRASLRKGGELPAGAGWDSKPTMRPVSALGDRCRPGGACGMGCLWPMGPWALSIARRYNKVTGYPGGPSAPSLPVSW